jgi:chromate transport protein ChrA
MPSLLSRLRTSIKDVRGKLLPSGDAVSKVAFLDMLAHNWSLGFTSFGGPAVHFQIFQQLFVENYHWIDQTRYQEMFALCQALSGPGSTKMIYGINVLHYGFWVGLAAFIVWSLPMAIASFGLAVGVGSIEDQLPGPAYALLSGLNSATVGIIALAAVQLSHKAVTDEVSRVLVFFGGAAGMLYNSLWYFPVLMVVGGAVTTFWDLRLVQRIWKKLRKGDGVGARERNESAEVEMGSAHTVADNSSVTSRNTRATGLDPSIQDATTSARHEETDLGRTSSWKKGSLIITVFLISFLVVMICRGTLNGRARGFDLFANLYLAGTIIFGGGPVVIPLLREYIVAPGWVSPRDFLLGLAITQAFPGPNFNFAVYLGALAVAGSSVPNAAGAIIAFLAIFTPGLWLHTGFMDLWPTLRKVHAVRACLRGIHATAVGLVYTAVYRLFEIGYLDEDVQSGGSLSRDPWWVVIVATSFVGGMYFKLSPPLAIVLGATMGLVRYGVVSA